MNNVKDAATRVAEAQKALEAAQKEAQAAGVAEGAIKVKDLLKKASRALWQICHDSDWPKDLQAVYRQVGKIENQLALAAFGAGERLALLAKLDANRWDAARDASGYSEDKDIFHSVATWMFDEVGRACNYKDEDEDDQEFYCGDDKNLSAVVALKEKILEVLGKDLGGKSIQAWEEGRHDT